MYDNQKDLNYKRAIRLMEMEIAYQTRMRQVKNILAAIFAIILTLLIMYYGVTFKNILPGNSSDQKIEKVSGNNANR